MLNINKSTWEIMVENYLADNAESMDGLTDKGCHFDADLGWTEAFHDASTGADYLLYTPDGENCVLGRV